MAKTGRPLGKHTAANGKDREVNDKVAAQLKKLIDAGDLEGARKLLDKHAATPPAKKEKEPKGPPKKPGRKPKPKVEQAEPKKRGRKPKVSAPTLSPANNDPEVPEGFEQFKGCVATSKRSEPQTGGGDKNFLRSVAWAPPKKINFVDDSRTPRENLNYPEPGPRREAAEQVEYICNKCNSKVLLYPSQIHDPDMIFRCDKCLKGSKRK